MLPKVLDLNCLFGNGLVYFLRNLAVVQSLPVHNNTIRGKDGSIVDLRYVICVDPSKGERVNRSGLNLLIFDDAEVAFAGRR